MATESIYTSAPRGLKPGSSGYCTVAHTKGMAQPLVDLLEGLSGYTPAFPPGDARAGQNPVNFSHLRVRYGGSTISVLSRVAFAGFDHTGRTNKLAHHVVVGQEEQFPAGPGAMLAVPGFSISEWRGEPGLIEAPRVLPAGNSALNKAIAWERLTGDAGWAGVLAGSFTGIDSAPVYMVFEPGMDVLTLICEALALVPESRRWQVTFSTYLTTVSASSSCHWRCCLPDAEILRSAMKAKSSLVIDLRNGTKMESATDSVLVTAARTGRPVNAQPISKAPTPRPFSGPKPNLELRSERAARSSFSKQGNPPSASTEVDQVDSGEESEQPANWGRGLIFIGTLAFATLTVLGIGLWKEKSSGAAEQATRPAAVPASPERHTGQASENPAVATSATKPTGFDPLKDPRKNGNSLEPSPDPSLPKEPPSRAVDPDKKDDPVDPDLSRPGTTEPKAATKKAVKPIAAIDRWSETTIDIKFTIPIPESEPAITIKWTYLNQSVATGSDPACECRADSDTAGPHSWRGTIHRNHQEIAALILSANGMLIKPTSNPMAKSDWQAFREGVHYCEVIAGAPPSAVRIFLNTKTDTQVLQSACLPLNQINDDNAGSIRADILLEIPDYIAGLESGSVVLEIEKTAAIAKRPALLDFASGDDPKIPESKALRIAVNTSFLDFRDGQLAFSVTAWRNSFALPGLPAAIPLTRDPGNKGGSIDPIPNTETPESYKAAADRLNTVSLKLTACSLAKCPSAPESKWVSRANKIADWIAQFEDVKKCAANERRAAYARWKGLDPLKGIDYEQEAKAMQSEFDAALAAARLVICVKLGTQIVPIHKFVIRLVSEIKK